MIGGKVALIVDDSKISRDILTAYLEERGYRTVCADDGSAGFEQFESVRPSIVFLDIMMPKLSGIELLRKNQIRALEIGLTLESVFPHGDRYASAAWQATIRPRSLHLN